MFTITVESLKRSGACASGIQDFQRAFPKGIPQDEKEALRIALKHAKELDFSWASCLLPKPFKREYVANVRQVVVAYNEGHRASFAKYRLNWSTDYVNKEVTAWRAHLKRKEALLSEYQADVAKAFVTAYFAAQ